MNYAFGAKLWRYPGKDPWYFVTVPRKFASEIKSLTSNMPLRGFGSIKVTVSIEDIKWETSIFPDKSSDSYVLPIKKEIRNRLGLEAEDRLAVKIRLREID